MTDHTDPPSTVLRMIPCEPTENPRSGEGKQTENKSSPVPDFITFQVVPPFVVFRIVPDSPTEYPQFASVKHTDNNEWPWGSGFCHTHCEKAKKLRKVKQISAQVFFIKTAKGD